MNFTIEDVPEFYRNYIRQVNDEKLIPLLLKSSKELSDICQGLTEQQAFFRYAEDKWSIKDIIQHLMDAERVFVYRAMRFARNDSTELPGFSENDYSKSANADSRLLHTLLADFTNLRTSTIDFFTSLSELELERSGMSSGVNMSVEMLGYIISGHTLHHLGVIKERYLK